MEDALGETDGGRWSRQDVEYQRSPRIVRHDVHVDLGFDFWREDPEWNVSTLQMPSAYVGIWAISEFPKGRKYLISLSFRGKSSVRPAQVGGFDVNIVIHGSTAVRRRGDLVAYGWALWKLTAPWTPRTRPPHLGKRCAFSTNFHKAFPIKSSTKNPKRPQNSVGKPG